MLANLANLNTANMTIVNIHQAKSQLSALIQKVLDGEQVIIAKNNNPLVSINLLAKPLAPRKPGLLKGKITYGSSINDGDTEVIKLLSEPTLIPDE